MHSAIRSLVVLLAILIGSANAALNLPAVDDGGTRPGSGQGLFLAPTITSVRGKVARVQVPPGYEQITIERRLARRSKPWTTFASQACSTEGGEVTVKLRRRMPKTHLRAIGRKAAAVPSSVPGRLSSFFPPPDGTASITLDAGLTFGSTMTLAGGVTSLSLDSGKTTATASREVVESDIWKLHGDRLYVFNSYRGLQALDLANPAEPVLLGTLAFPDTGDALYLLGDTHAALLTKRAFTFTWNNEPLRNNGSLVICDVRAAQPVAVASLPLQGEVVESRLVGTALYVATAEHLVGDGWYNWRRSIRVTGYDLSDPAHPIERNSVVIAPPAQDSYSYLGAVQASEAYFMVAENLYVLSGRWGVSGGYRTRVSLIDISSPDGTVRARGAVSSAGFVEDKFKMQERGGILTVISNVQSARNTRLENFTLKTAGAPAPLGSLVLGQNESVRGTRFDGDRVYVVTFLQIDPLWIVDNSKPSAPNIVGHLDVPGFSTYLEPLGDRLVTIGLLDNRVAVSLFDVADPAKPKLLSQLPVTEPWAWSEATWNEKAFSVNPAAGLIMLPVNNGWRHWWGGGSTSGGGIQLVDLEREQLKVRGRIDRDFVPRRSTFHRGTIVAIGDSTLLTADTTDRDKPAILAEVQLAWRTDFAWPIGNYLLQVGAEIGGANPVVTVSPSSDPDATLSSLHLGERPVVAADLRDGYLYVVQRAEAGTSVRLAANSGYTLTVVNVSSVPQLLRSGQVFLPATGGAHASVRLAWPQPGTLVIAAQEYAYSYWDGWLLPIFIGEIRVIDLSRPTVMPGELMITNTSFRSFEPSAHRLHLIACDVSDPAAPSFLTQTTLAPKLDGSFSEVLAAEGKLFVSSQAGWGRHGIFTISITGSGTVSDHGDAGRHFLHVVDYSDPAAPVSRPPVSAPGALQGLTRRGTIVYTQGHHYDESGCGIAGSSVLHASVYDGVKLELASDLPLEGGGRALALGEQIFTFFNQATVETDGKLASYAALWELQHDLQFVRHDEIRFGGWDERALDGMLFTTNFGVYGTAVSALDFSNPGDLRSLGSFGVPWLENGLRHMTGDRSRGFWVPAANFGLLKLSSPSP